MLLKFSPYLIAMLIGLLIGTERERRGLQVKQVMGVRSFLIIAMTGAIAGGINQSLVTLGFLVFIAATVVVGYNKSSRSKTQNSNPKGITTELAAIVTFGLGYLVHLEPFISLALAVVVLLLLHNKTTLHDFIKTRLLREEIQAAAILLLLAIGVVPLLPDKPIDPLNIFNPFRLGWIIALIAFMQFAGYIASRLFGDRIGLPLSGFLAGIVSSTAAFATLPGQALEKPNNFLAFAGAAALAITGTMSKLPFIIGVISLPLLVAVIIPVVIIILISAAIGIILARSNPVRGSNLGPKNPLRLFSALKIGSFIMLFILVVELTQRYLGTAYTNVVTFLGGLFELDGVVIAGANMFNHQAIDLKAGANAIFIAITASMISKVILTAIIARSSYRIVVLIFTSALLILCVGILLLINFFPDLLIKM